MIYVLLLFAAAALRAQPPADLNFLSGQVDGRQLRDTLPKYLQNRAFRMLEERRSVISKLGSMSDLEARRRYFRERFVAALGGWPERTPLNAKITGRIEFDSYRIEKIVFESQPGFFVTANLYLPKSGAPPYPAILFPIGHESGAKAHSAWQQVLVSVARKGYVALTWDTLGQGERIQLWDEDFGASKLRQSTTEHTMIGLQTLLVGDPLARYTIWDGIRALDYLVSRPEVDRSRIGLTGNSGGGTHSAYLGALDDRFAAIAPSCYLTTWRRLLETIGPQDAEQCVPPSLADGLDHADFVLAAAPKPYLMLTAIRDFFSISGARETYAEVARVYERLGQAERFARFEYDDGHGYSAPRRLAAYRWFGKWLKGAEDTAGEPDVALLGEEQLWATSSGQVATEYRGETVHSLNLKRLAQVRRAPPSPQAIRNLIRFEPAGGAPPSRGFGELTQDGFRIEKLVYEPEPGIVVPALLYLPSAAGRRPAVLVAHGQGKAAAHEHSRRLVRDGNVVLAIDLRGTGETRVGPERPASDWSRYFGDYESAMTALLTGKPLLAMRAEDIVRGIDLLAARPETDLSRIAVYALEAAAPPAAHAALFDSRIRALVLEKMHISWEAVVRGRIHREQWENAVAGVLRHYDLPDLAGLIAPRPVQLIDPVTPLGQPAPEAEARRLYPKVELLRRRPDGSLPARLAAGAF